MKKLDKKAFAEKASKIKENIKMPQVRFPKGKRSKKDGSQTDALKKDEGRAEGSREDIHQTGTASGNVYPYQRENGQRELYQTGTISGSTYRTGAPRRDLYQTGTISGNSYRPGTLRRNLGQTGVLPGNTYRTEAPQRNLYQTGVISGSTYRGEIPQKNLYQTGGISDNAYPMDTPQSSNRKAEPGQGAVRRRKSTQGARYRSERPQEKPPQTEPVQRDRSQARTAGENGGQRSAPQRNRRQTDPSRRNGYQAVGSVRGSSRTGVSGAVAAYIKIALVAVLLLFIFFDLSNEPDSAAQIETVAENVVKAAGLQSSEPAEARMVKRFYGLNPNDYDGAVLYAPMDNMDAHELFLVKLKDDTQKKTVEDAIEERLETQLKSFEGYGAEQTALLEKHVLSVKGNFVLYIVGEYAEDAQKAFAESL